MRNECLPVGDENQTETRRERWELSLRKKAKESEEYWAEHPGEKPLALQQIDANLPNVPRRST